MKRIKVPVILQMEAVECGAASLAMVLAYYKRYIPLEKLREDCGVSRNGSDAKSIALAAQNHGLSVKAVRCEIEYLQKCDSFPVIIHWNFNHFVVLTGFSKNAAFINDPASGSVEIPLEEFDRSFTGIALFFEPSDNFEPQGKPKSVLKYLLRRLEGCKAIIIFILTMGVLLTAASTLNPVFYKIFVDKILIGGRDEWLYPLIFGMTVSLFAGFLAGALQRVVLHKLKTNLAVRSNTMFFWHVIRLPVTFFMQRFAGDVARRQENNTLIVAVLAEIVIPVFLHIALIVVYFVLLMYYSASMAIVGIGAAILEIAVSQFLAKQSINANRNMRRDEGKMGGVMISGVTMIETIKASGAENGYFERLSGYMAKYMNSQSEIQRRGIFSQLASMLLSDLSTSIILILGMYNILSGQMTVGTLMAFQGFMTLFLEPVENLSAAAQDIQVMTGQCDAVEDVMNYETDTEIDFNDNGRTCERLLGDVELRHITFGYSRLNAPLINDFNLSVKRGQTVALVGGSGSGKSTIAKLICGLYKPIEGEILFDGMSRAVIDRYVITNSVAMVEQDITLFHDTIKNNLTLWNDLIDENTIIRACKDACIHDDIMARKEGYDFVVNEGGANFSGGQRQRMEIARALIINPSVIILDEATSALDPVTEKNIMDAIKRRGITCFIIAHRLTTIRDADEIILLEYGKDMERGTHETLMSQNGKYAALIRSE